MLRRDELASWGEWQSNDSKFRFEGALTLKAFVDSARAMQGTDSNSLPNDLEERRGVYSWIRFDW